jgi:hypothetical protein
VVLFTATAALAQTGRGPASGRTNLETPIALGQIPTLRIVLHGRSWSDGGGFGQRDECTIEASHTDANWEEGEFVLQAGFAEQEMAANSYTLAAEDFPIRLLAAEMIFATYNTREETTTKWSLLIWDGPPDDGILVAEFNSNGEDIPHIVIPAGTHGVNVRVEVDPSDPDQIYINDDSGTHTLSIAYRIDEHNDQRDDPCEVPPPKCCNAFPTTDNTGLDYSSGNWLYGLDCGPYGCPANGGWSTFKNLASYCRPSGDWVQRAFYEPADCQPGVGACCLTDGTCDTATQGDCDSLGGSYQGDGTRCGDVDCPEPEGACCFESTGGCLDFTEEICAEAGGIWKGGGTTCDNIVCFPKGACCLEDGSCVGDQSPEDCEAQGGVFQGDQVSCSDVDCPNPVGSCCLPNQFCIDLIEEDCNTIGGTWSGFGTTCDQPVVTDQPDHQEVCEGASVTFTVKACGKKTLTYQWRKDGLDIDGATSDSLTLSSVTPDDIAGYDVVVKNDTGETTSEVAYLGVAIRCDSNCDGSVDFNDIDSFVQALIDRDAWEFEHGCDYLCVNDANRDGTVDFADIDLFVECLTE